MSSTLFLIAATFFHLALVAMAAISTFSVPGYTSSQRALQVLFALALPLVGSIVVIAVAKAAIADPPEPHSSSFDQQTGNAD
ncbi:hypothetical protein [Aquimonas sp.]|jgi:hypothetical protein|uniref:hypothetical protein n=1 Tax=Aquimonas sp. TaxID=1872588 RepID=UPI0037C11BA3